MNNVSSAGAFQNKHNYKGKKSSKHSPIKCLEGFKAAAKSWAKYQTELTTRNVFCSERDQEIKDYVKKHGFAPSIGGFQKALKCLWDASKRDGKSEEWEKKAEEGLDIYK